MPLFVWLTARLKSLIGALILSYFVLGGAITLYAQGIDLKDQCASDERISLAAVGDLLLHSPLQRKAYSHKLGFRSLWQEVEAVLKAPDITYGNLEGPIATGISQGLRKVKDPGKVFDNRVYTSFPLFNYHRSLVTDLKQSGFDIVSTANNHSLDRGSIGAEKTIEELKAGNLPYCGTRLPDDPRAFYHIIKSKGFNIAFLACTFSTNGIPDRKDLVLMCYEDREEMLALIKELNAREDVDAVILTPHWGYEYNRSPNLNQRKLAQQVLDAGAVAVIGTHPHTLQPWKFVTSPEGDQRLVIYSTGNFVSNQKKVIQRAAIIGWLEFCPSKHRQNKLALSKAGYFPIWMRFSSKGPHLVQHTDKKAFDGARQGYQQTVKLLPKGALMSWKKQGLSLPSVMSASAKPWLEFHP